MIVDNFIGKFENAFDDKFCASVIKYYDTLSEQGFTHTRQDEGAPKLAKDGSFAFSSSDPNLHHSGDINKAFTKTFWDYCYRQYAEKFSVLQDAGSHSVYATKIQKTDVGQGYHTWHFETMTRTTANRILQYIVYLNDVEEGGETEFLYIPKRIKPTKGTLLLFPAGFTHTHRGNPPISNTKYIITGWVEY